MRSLLPVLALFLVAACSSTTTSSGDGGTTPTGTSTGGTTKCGEQSCQAGSYCLNLACVPGCLSVSNCTSTEECDKSSGDIGTCKAKSGTTEPDASTPSPATDCDAFCKKSEGCDPKSWATVMSQCATAKGRTCTCTDVCGALTSSCVSCINKAATCGDADKNCSTACK